MYYNLNNYNILYIMAILILFDLSDHHFIKYFYEAKKKKKKKLKN